MTHPHDDPRVEPDPTGMRDLLSRLPDPGPMPDELVARITAALEAEADAGRTPAAVVPLRSSRLRHIGVAAAVVAALGLGTYGLAVVQQGGSASIGAAAGGGDAESKASDGAGDTSADAGAESAEGEPGASAPALRSAPAPGSGEVVVVMSGTEHATATLATSASAVADAPLAPLPELAAEAPAIGPIGTPVGARSCADALGIPRSAGLLVDVSEVDGRPAAVLVAFEPGGRTAYAVDRSCTTGTTGPISAPVPLD